MTIVGLGLIGGSLGMAIKRHRLAGEVIGCSRKPSTLRAAQRRRAIDRGTTDLRRAVSGAEVVVIATPVDAIIPLARQAASAMRAGAILTDVGSSKQQIVQALERQLPKRMAFVGGHPLAGSEQHGIEAADAALFDGSVCILTPTRQTSPRALEAVKRLWKPLVRRVLVMSPQRHDQLLGAMSHLPHLIAYTLMASVNRDELMVAPPSFLDVTRIAKSDPLLWDGIFLSNRRELLKAMDRFDRQWRRLRASLSGAQRARLHHLLAHAQRRRAALHDA